MKEVKFRIWARNNKKMSYQKGDRIDLFFNSLSFPLYWGVLMQFTGLRERTANTSDKREVYEGDVVRCWGGEYCQGYWEHDEMIVIKDMINDCFIMGESEYIQVIGNVYENPELVEKVENKNKNMYKLNF